MESNYRDGPTGHNKLLSNPWESNHRDSPMGHKQRGRQTEKETETEIESGRAT